MNDEIIDVFDLIADEAQRECSIPSEMPTDEALFTCLNDFGRVDVEYIAQLCGESTETVVEKLRGAIFQDPEYFLAGREYDIGSGWALSSKYLSGNVRKKLARAEYANKKFGGRFAENIERLKAVLPDVADIEDIHISLGASWIPAGEVEMFIARFLNLGKAPEVYFYKDLLTYKILPTKEAKESVLNTITFGVRGNVDRVTGYCKQYLTALDIIEQTMNAKTIKVFDYIPKGNGLDFEYEPIFNRQKTVEAQEKQKAIIDAFQDYVYGDRARTVRFEQYYNEKMVGYTYSQYDGAFLALPDLNPEVVLYKHQRDAIARVLLSGENLLLAHDVGTGKTYEMIVSLHEMYRMGISKKNLMVVPNNVLQATADAHRLLYKNDKILVVYPKDFTPERRNYMLELIRDGDYAAVYMAYSSFDMVVMSRKYYIDKMNGEIKTLSAAVYNAGASHEKHKLESKKKALEKKLLKYMAEASDSPWLTFDKLGITTLVVDEAHNYKNVPIRTCADGIVGMGGYSKKCSEMLEKAHFVRRLIFATGTPLTNSLADLFTFQTYLQPEALKYHKIHTFDAWVNTFGERETTIECDVDANSRSLRTMTRFSSFHNLSELMSLFSQVCDFHHLDESEEGMPDFNGYENICVPKNRAQHEYINELSERTDKIRSRKVKRSEDNLLKVTTDGRMAALDIRLVRCDAPYDKKSVSKTDACAAKVVELYHKYPASVQVVFSDIGTPKARFNVYDELAFALTAWGIPRCEIAFVHDATTERARAKLFEAMNKGTVRVVVGSTQKLGVGVNV
ncbi:MAG: SNF2-related protein [Clostridia bacterium]|nr:SNF2-related protein [Clostridia bacterium]